MSTRKCAIRACLTPLILLICLNTVVGQFESSLNDLDSKQTVVMRLEPQPQRMNFMHQSQPPRAVPKHVPTQEEQEQPRPKQAQVPQQIFNQAANRPQQQPQQQLQTVPPPPVGAQQPILPSEQLQPVAGTQSSQFVPRETATLAPAPPVNIPPDVQNQLIKFFGLDSFGIPGLTGNHPNGFAGAIQVN